MHEDAAANQSDVVASGSFTTYIDLTTLGFTVLLDPEDTATLWQDTGATVAADDDAEPVRLIQNKGSATFDLTAASDAARPLHKTSGGLHWLLGNGVNDLLASAAAISNIVANNEFDIYVAYRFNTIGTDSANYYGNDPIFTTSSDMFAVTARSSGPLHAGHWDGSQDKVIDAVAAGTDYVARFQHTGGNLIFTIDNGTASTPVASGNTTTMTDLLRLFGSASGIFADARLYGLCIKNAQLSSADAAAVVTRLGAKQGRAI
jgi:hypothetical protein